MEGDASKAVTLPSSPELRARLDSMALRRGWPVSSEVGRLGRVVASLSAAYNTTGRSAPEHLPARLAFWLPRDLPKVYEATRELRHAQLLLQEDTVAKGATVRVLDIGAGLGASALGLLYAIREVGHTGPVHVTLVDDDAAALAIAKELLSAMPNVHAVSMPPAPARAYGTDFDVVILSQVLSELDQETLSDEEARARKHAAFLLELGKDVLAASGTILVVEPALRERTRHLHRVRSAVLEDGTLRLFAPCLHTDVCPALAIETDWCHEDRRVDLPDYLVPLAKNAGLRWEGLTFSFLALRRMPENAANLLPATSLRKRAVSEARKTKGKVEVLLCGDRHAPSEEHRLRYQRLDRDESEANALFAELRRGDLIGLSEDLSRPGRVCKQTQLTRGGAG